MEIQQRKSVIDELKKYCYCSNCSDDFIEVTEWNNGEGIDVTIHSHGQDKFISLTHGELDAILYLKMTLEYQK